MTDYVIFSRLRCIYHQALRVWTSDDCFVALEIRSSTGSSWSICVLFYKMIWIERWNLQWQLSLSAVCWHALPHYSVSMSGLLIVSNVGHMRSNWFIIMSVLIHICTINERTNHNEAHVNEEFLQRVHLHVARYSLDVTLLAFCHFNYIFLRCILIEILYRIPCPTNFIHRSWNTDLLIKYPVLKRQPIKVAARKIYLHLTWLIIKLNT